MSKTKTNLFSNILMPLLTVSLIVAAFFIGSLYTKVQMLEKSTDAGENQQQVAAQPQAQRPTKGVASVDDDPILGDKDAPVTIIEFSDYECPFCKRHFDETLPQLIENYVKPGKVKIVFRDLPLGFHEPMATKEAIAANCAREQGGDTKYFQYHDEIFTRTISNGNGLSENDLTTIALDTGLDINSFNSCLLDPAQEDEVRKDVADASKAGASGTPTFVIGKSSSSGEIDGELLVGAQPYAAFQVLLDSLL